MPVYEYHCESCGKRLEKIQKFSDPPLTQCEVCGGPLKKVLSAPALVFKGTGWYVTDYAGKKQEKEKSAAGEDQSSKEKAKDTGTSPAPSTTTSPSPQPKKDTPQ
jgi:putative FmdB family regulatory protein